MVKSKLLEVEELMDIEEKEDIIIDFLVIFWQEEDKKIVGG